MRLFQDGTLWLCGITWIAGCSPETGSRLSRADLGAGAHIPRELGFREVSGCAMQG